MQHNLQSVGDMVKTRMPSVLADSWIVDDKSVHIPCPDGEWFIGIRYGANRWDIEAKHGHTHRKDLDEAIDIMKDLLEGRSQFIEEYRGDELSAGWLETLYENETEESDDVLFFDPFDPDEWIAWPGENWRQIRYSLDVNVETGQISESSQHRLPSDFRELPAPTQWISDGLGHAEFGMKWTLGAHRRFVFQCPVGWRKAKRDHSVPSQDFHGQTDGMGIRSTALFKAVEGGQMPIRQALPPESIEYSYSTLADDWFCHRWTMHFNDQENEMMGIVDFFFHGSRVAKSGPIAELLRNSVSQALFTPHDWNMTRDPMES